MAHRSDKATLLPPDAVKPLVWKRSLLFLLCIWREPTSFQEKLFGFLNEQKCVWRRNGDDAPLHMAMCIVVGISAENHTSYEYIYVHYLHSNGTARQLFRYQINKFTLKMSHNFVNWQGMKFNGQFCTSLNDFPLHTGLYAEQSHV